MSMWSARASRSNVPAAMLAASRMHPVLLDRVHGVAADDAFGDGGLACLGQDGVGQGGRGGGFALDAFRGVSFEAVAFDEAYVGGFEPVHAYGADDGGDVVFDAEPV